MTKEQKHQTALLSLVAIGAITLLELVALWKGIDGKLFALAIAGIAGAGGFTLRSLLK